MTGVTKLGLLGGAAAGAATATTGGGFELTPYLTQYGRGNNSPVR